MRSLDDVFPALSGSAFRRRFHLAPKDRTYLATHGLAAVMVQAEELTDEQQAHVIAALERWLRAELGPASR